MTNTIATNLSINCHNKKVKYNIDYSILHINLVVTLLLLMIVVLCYHYAKHRSKLKKILRC